MNKSKRITNRSREELLLSLCRIVASVKDPVEAAELVKDIFTENELEVVAKRAEVARLLLKDCSFDDIVEILGVGRGTIARVSSWLREGGEGLRIAIRRTDEKPKEKVEKWSWSSLKRRYPIYYWPGILLEEVISCADKRERERMLKVLNKIKTKTSLYRKLSQILRKGYSYGNHEVS